MKIIIGYDGSQTADAALDDLKLAGLPSKAEVIVMAVAEVWLPPENIEENAVVENAYIEQISEMHRQKNKKAVAEVETLARQARERLLKNFPDWEIFALGTYGSPAWEIITKANEIKADLIIVGSHGRSTVGRLFLGSISQKVLTEANCSVRVARGKVEADPFPTRVVIGYDGSPGSNAAVKAVAARSWHEHGEFCLLAVTDPITPSAIGFIVPPIDTWIEEANQGGQEWIEKIAANALQQLHDAGLKATLEIQAGNPKNVLVEKAENWHANSIFVGANQFGSRVERFLLGSVSAAVAARAQCSVEVVRS
ncbi:MAG: Universal stress protein UspA-like nucleotide-binding protein [Acidobacteria bacterium]|jgi:nucleotide-binding universal stress UspA family protein|nr:Universal stress protein UspA-like nucleotide-binding protein [Acidobacteriota bacterium]